MTDAPKRGLFIRLTRLPVIRSLLHIKKNGNSRSGLFAQFDNKMRICQGPEKIF